MEQHWKPKKVDLYLSVLIAFLFPIIANVLYKLTGALIPMLVYYGLAWGISLWRRGKSGYLNKPKKILPISFVVNLIIIGISLVFAYFARNLSIVADKNGAILTALVWVPINASSEQLLWIYLYDTWDYYTPTNQKYTTKSWIWMRRGVGIILFTAFIGTIHTFFWVEFLHTVVSDTLFGILFVVFTAVSGFLHIIAWRESNNMIYTFIPHFFLNLVPLFWTGYSIIPYLLNF
jgi:uncharacterized membrane protein